jgi:protoheme IX farnesyltransferase
MRVDSGVLPIAAPQAVWSKTSDFIELTKPGVTTLVLFTTFVGFYAGTKGTMPLLLLFNTLAGTALMAGASAAFNMYAERRLDAMMKRTALRPLAAGRLGSHHALLFALAALVAGFGYLLVFVNPLTALLSAAISASYLFLYTPLKKRTWLCTLIGAVPGALPVVIGWTAANAAVSVRAWVLFAIIFLWQLPHFYSIGWMYREDYARAGVAVLSVVDLDGQRTARQAALFILILISVTLLPFYFNMAGIRYLAGALVLGSGFLAFGIRFARFRNRASAKQLFRASALYLPLLLILLVLDKTGMR